MKTRSPTSYRKRLRIAAAIGRAELPRKTKDRIFRRQKKRWNKGK